jgi:hypothetical protein
MSRYETTHPPRKDQLLKFQQIAAEQGRSLLRNIEANVAPDSEENLNRVWKLAELARTFNTLYISELIDSIGSQFFVFRDWAGEGPHAFLLAKFKGLNGMRAAMSLMNLVTALESRSTKNKRTALEILDYMEKKQEDLIGKSKNVDEGGALIADAFKNDLDLLRNSLKGRH